MLLLFDGTEASGAFSTLPVIFTTLVPTLEFIVIVFTKLPGRPWVLYVAVTFAVLPGQIGSLGQVGVVQPQEA